MVTKTKTKWGVPVGVLAFSIFLLPIVVLAWSGGDVQELAPGVISTGRGFTVTFSPDSRDAYFTAREPAVEGTKPPLHIYRSHLENGTWQPAKPVAFSSEKWSDLDPFVTVDGNQMYFVSTRPAPGKEGTKPDMDIWCSDLKNGEWGAPHWIAEVNSTAKEGSPSLDRAKRLYFFSDRGSEPGQNSIYVSEWRGGHFSPPEKLSKEINAGPSDTSPWIAPDGKTLLFYSTREGGYGKADLYASFSNDDRWSKSLNLGPVVNTDEFEYNPCVSRDGTTLYFGRNGKIYAVPLSALHLKELDPRLFQSSRRVARETPAHARNESTEVEGAQAR